MVTYWAYDGTETIQADLPTGVLDEWKTTLKGEQARIYASLIGKIASYAKYKDYLADPSSDRYEAFLSAVGDGWIKANILLKQRTKLLARYPEWDSGVDACFGVGGYFPTNVDAKAVKLKLARYTIGAVGHRATITDPWKSWAPVTIGILLLRGDKRPLKYKDDDDTYTNEANIHAVVDATKGRLITPSIMAHAIFGSVMARFMYDANKTPTQINDWLNTADTGVNAVIDALLQVALDTAHLTPPKDVTYALSWVGDTTNKCKVTVTDIH